MASLLYIGHKCWAHSKPGLVYGCESPSARDERGWKWILDAVIDAVSWCYAPGAVSVMVEHNWVFALRCRVTGCLETRASSNSGHENYG